LIAFLCAVSSSQDGISAAEVELRVRPGDNITLYCDCIITTEVYIMWILLEDDEGLKRSRDQSFSMTPTVVAMFPSESRDQSTAFLHIHQL
ncbi:hypothetical protein J4Q44_G00038470, partial [Coregonus suidteri]